MSPKKNDKNPSSEDSQNHFEKLTEVLRRQGIIKEPGRRGFFGNILDGPTLESQALRWLISERSRIANLFAQQDIALSSQMQSQLLREQYGPALTGALLPVIEDVGLTSMILRGRNMDLPIVERVNVLTQLGLIAEAIPLLRGLQNQLVTERNKIICANNLAYCLARQEEPDLQEAVEIAQRALSRTTNDELVAMISDTLAFAFFRLGEYEKARQKIDVALDAHRRLNKDNPVVHYHYWQICAATCEKRLAENHLRIACKLVGGPYRLARSVNLVELAVGEDEVIEIINSWLAENSGILVRLGNLFESQLRPALRRSRPSSEKQISDVVETILRVAFVDPQRESVRIQYSGKGYIPDFVLPRLGTVIEVKFVGNESASRRIIAEINDDKCAYLSEYPRIFFLVYDLGFISDIRLFSKDIEDVGVCVLIVKH